MCMHEYLNAGAAEWNERTLFMKILTRTINTKHAYSSPAPTCTQAMLTNSSQ